MRYLNKTAFLVLFFILIKSTSVFSQGTEDKLLEEIRDAYNQLNYTEAVIKAKMALQNYERFNSAQLTEIHKILALIFFSQNESEKARIHFENALSLTPELILDSLFVSPKILDFFNRVKEEREQKLEKESNPKSEIRYVLVQDPRASAALRSMILPGWGQLFKGEKTKGKVLLSLWSLGIVGSVVSHLARERAEDKYLSETNPAKIESRYNTFNTYHKLRNNLILFSAVIWIYSYFDAVLKGRPLHIESSSSKNAFLIFPSISSQQTKVSFILNF